MHRSLSDVCVCVCVCMYVCNNQLCSMHQRILKHLFVKSVGHQWSYEYSRLHKARIRFIYSTTRRSTNQYIPTARYRQPCLTTNKFTNSINRNSSRCITLMNSTKVGFKTDATPGRLNQVKFWIKRSGRLYGQCSGIYGANHRFIPIVIERVSTNQFINK